MKQRIISAAVALTLLAVILFFVDTAFFNIALAAVGQLALVEVVRAFCKRVKPGVFIPCSLYLAGNMFFNLPWLFFLMLLIFLLFSAVMLGKEKTPYRDISAVFMLTVVITYGFLSLLGLKNMGATLWDKRVLIIFGLGFGFACDVFSYFFGRFFGIHKLSRNISPNKTVEGAIAGVLGAGIFGAGLYSFYSGVCAADSVFQGGFSFLSAVFFAAAGLVGSLIGIIGDLSFSYVKRECGIKDFGKVMPGHGGALDRIDSALFTSVFAFFAFVMYFNYF